MKASITFALLAINCGLNLFSQIEGEYNSVGYYNHPTTPRSIQTNKIVTKVSDSVYVTTVGDLNNGTLTLNIHKNNAVSFENSLTSTGVQIFPIPDSVNSIDPATKKIVLHYQFTLSTDTRYIREEMTRLLQFRQNDIDYVQISPTEVKVLKGDSCKGAVTIPSKVTYLGQEFRVTKIENKALLNNSNLTSVSLPSSISVIGERAFGWCKNLSSINIPDSVIYIGTSAFSTTNISSIQIPKHTIELGSQLCYQCRSLSAINVDIENPKFKSVDGVLFTKDGKELLEYPNGKQTSSYSIPSGTTKVISRAFDGGNNYLESINIPEGVSECGNWSFMNLSNLKSISIPSSLKTFKGALSNSSALESISLSSYNPYYRIAEGVLYTNKLDTLIQFPAKLKVSELRIPNTIKYIESMAFINSAELSTIHLPNTLKEIGWIAFGNCKKLSSVYSYSTTPIVLNVTGLSDVGKNPAVLYVPIGSKSLYENTSEWKDFTNIVEMTTGIEQQAESYLRIYPNPTTDFIQISGLNGNTKIEIYNLSGKLLEISNMQFSSNRIDIRTLPKGIYMLKVHNQNGVEIAKFIKE